MKQATLISLQGTIEEIAQHACETQGRIALVSNQSMQEGELVMLEGVPLRVVRLATGADLTPTQIDVWRRHPELRGMLYLMEAAD